MKYITHNTNLLLSNGEIKKIQDLRIDDILCGENDDKVKIKNIKKCECENDMCNFIIIPLASKNFQLYGFHKIPVYFDNTKTYVSCYDFYRFFNKEKNVFLYNHSYNFEFIPDQINIDPYFLGIWLCQYAKKGIYNSIPTDRIRIYLSHDFMKMYVEKMISNFNLQFESSDEYIDIFNDKFVSVFKDYNLLEENNLHIPLDYKVCEKKNRIQLVSALCDMLGKNDYNENDFIFDEIYNEKFLFDCCFILNSLGFETSIIKKNQIKFFSKVSKNESQMLTPVNVNNYFQVAPIFEKRYYTIELDCPCNILLDDFTVV
jgi:hypothetical protein